MYTVKVWGDDMAPDSTNPYPLLFTKGANDIQEAKLMAYEYWRLDLYTGVGVYRGEQFITGYGLTHS